MPTVTLEEILDRVDKIGPVIREHSEEAEQARRLSRPVIDAMLDAGLFTLTRPEAFGGLELDPVSTLRVVEEVSRHDSAAGWILNISLATGHFLAWLPDDGAAEILAAPDVVLGGAFHPPGAAVAVDGGWEVSGRWRFASGCEHDSWFLVLPLVMDGDEPAVDSSGNPRQLFAWLPADGVEIIDTWYSLGMRGTGSHDIEARRCFVPLRRTAPLVPLEQPGARFSGPLYRLGLWPPVGLLAPPALGVARRAIEDFLELGRAKTPSFTANVLRTRQVVQSQVAQAEAHLGAGRAYLHRAFDDVWRVVTGGEPLDLAHKLAMQLATTHSLACAAAAVDLVCAAAGSSIVPDSSDLQRCFRDVHTITQHAFASAQRYESVGAHLLGAESDWGFFAF